MESDKRPAGAMTLVAVMLVLQLLMTAAPTTMAQSVQEDQDTSPVLALNTIAREFSYANGAVPRGESCVFLPCVTKIIGCKCRKRICVK